MTSPRFNGKIFLLKERVFNIKLVKIFFVSVLVCLALLPSLSYASSSKTEEHWSTFDFCHSLQGKYRDYTGKHIGLRATCREYHHDHPDTNYFVFLHKKTLLGYKVMGALLFSQKTERVPTTGSMLAQANMVSSLEKSFGVTTARG